MTNQRSLAVLTLLLTACSGGSSGGGGGTGTLTIEATDKFLPHSEVAVARIDVNRVQVLNEEDQEGFRAVYEGDPIQMDLLQLQNGVKRRLAQSTLPAGTYRQIRLRFDDAYLELVNGNRYTTSDGTLKLSSQSTSGLKVFVDPPIQLSGGVSRTLLLDFDLTKTFKPVPANEPLNASTYKLHPVIKASNMSKSGELRGTVFTTNAGTQTGVGSATVTILPPGELDPENGLTSTGTNANGSWAVIGLEPGIYDVHAMRGALEGRVNAVEVELGGITVVDIEIQ